MKSLSAAFLALIIMIANAYGAERTIAVGSKKFTESVLLGEMAAQLLGSEGFTVHRRLELGGTQVLWNALLGGEIDLYPEYTGTISQEILAGAVGADTAEIRRALERQGILMSAPLGFNNTYALGMQKNIADSLGIRTISDLAKYPDLALGFSNEFMDRGDGWPGLRQAYELPHSDATGLDHDLAYRGLQSGSIQVMDLYSTDAEIRYYDLRTLIDDRGYFPEYNAVILYRADLEQQAVGAIRVLEGLLPEDRMIALNSRAKLDKTPAQIAVADYLRAQLGVNVAPQTETRAERIWKHTVEHLVLVCISLFGAILVAIPIGIWAAYNPGLGQVILGAVGVIQTIPSLALLVFMIPILGIGGPPAIVALFLYSLLPIVRNTYSGLSDTPASIRESAAALGLPPAVQLWRIRLPMASRSILAGIKTSAVINVGTATLGALIGAGGYGQPILTGIRLDDTALILEGAIPAALLALAAQGVFDAFERIFVPKGLRLASGA